MEDWRERIIGEFPSGLSGSTVASDPDGLLFEAKVYQQLSHMGFQPILLEDPSGFHQAPHWYHSPSGAAADHGWVAVFRTKPQGLSPPLPQNTPILSFSLARLFPELDASVLKSLSVADLDALDQAVAEFSPKGLTAWETSDFLLRHVYHVAPELVKQPHDLLALLLRLFFRSRPPAGACPEHLVSYWRNRGAFADWPLGDILLDSSAFLTFLQERWPLFLDQFAQNMALISDWGAPYGFEYPGPLELPFGHDDVKSYMERLFAEGWLEPVEHHQMGVLAGTWAAVGLVHDPASHSLRRLHLILSHMVENLPDADSDEADWRRFARNWAQSQILNKPEWYVEAPESRFGLQKIQATMDRSYESWTAVHYRSLSGRSIHPPVTIHHLPLYLAKIMRKKNARLALIVVGGLTLGQWLVVRQVLKYQAPDFRFREQSLFAGLPTLTAVNRQAIFSGREGGDMYDADPNPGQYASNWSRFWVREGLEEQNILFMDVVMGESLRELENRMARQDVMVAGLTVDTLNGTGPGRWSGKTSRLSQARQWSQSGLLAALIDRLLVSGFQVWVSSDHGRIDTVGVGRIDAGASLEPGGERVACFQTVQERSQAAGAFPEADPGPAPSRPGRIPPLYAPGRSSFRKKGVKAPAHGGCSLEETIVPLVEVFSRSR